MNDKENRSESGILARLRREFFECLYVSLYLWVCFSVLIFYETAISQQQHVWLVPLGSALVKALILGKFIVIGKAIKVGDGMKHGILLPRIAWKSIAMLLLLIVFKVLEEIVAGLVQGHTVAAVWAEFIARPWPQNVAPALVMLLVLIPLIAWEELDKTLGKGSLRRMMFQRPDRS